MLVDTKEVFIINYLNLIRPYCCRNMMSKKPKSTQGVRVTVGSDVSSVVVHPIVGKLVEAGGERLPANFIVDLEVPLLKRVNNE